jgi:ClpP class serine protease
LRIAPLFVCLKPKYIMNFPLAKEIYGNPWSVDAVSFLQLTSILKNIQNGVALESMDSKLNSIAVYSETRLIEHSDYLKNSDSFDGIGVVNLNGPITKNGGASSYGTKYLAQSMLQMSKDSRIKGFVIKTDSGGGATGAVSLMQEAISKVKETKPVYALVEKGGMAGSAAYGIISGATKIFSEDEMNVVGSVGTMIQFSGKPNGTVDTDGEKHITLYATKSTAKNKGFEEAIENDNYQIIVNELLDPINENFISSVLKNRPSLEGSSFDNGHTVFSKDAVGTFIDGIASFDEVVNMILNNNEIQTSTNKSNINSKSNKMNREEIKSQFPTVYSEIVSEGVAKEKERVASWMVYSQADPEAVKKGIESGAEITASQSHAFLVKIASNGRLQDLKSDNAPAISTPESSTNEEGVVSETEHEKEVKAAFAFEL